MFAELTVVLICIVGSAFFAGIETGVISIHRIRFRHHVEENEEWALIYDDFLNKPDRLFGTTLVGTNLCTVVASVLVASIGTRLLGAWGEVLLGLVLTLVLLVFGEYLPKAWFQSQPMKRCRPFAKVLHLSWQVFLPLSNVVTWLTNWVVRKPAEAQEGRSTFITKDELKVLAQEGELHGVLSPKQRIMIHRVFELSGKTAAQVMVRRDRMVIVGATSNLEEFYRAAQTSGFTRFPVFDEGQRKFVGIVNLYEALASHAAGSAVQIREFMRPPQFVRDNTPLTEILPRLRQSRQPLCLVTDAHSEVIGLVTTQNIVEEIVGKL